MTVHLVLGLGFGDEGKGAVVDWLARRLPSPPLVVRYNGGPQAAHHVVTDDGRVHCFSQLGSASFVDGARTHLAGDMAVDPYALHAEVAAFGDPDVLGRVTVDPRCLVVTPWHAIVGRLREERRGPARHGTTGRGVREAKLGPVRLAIGACTPRALAAARDALLAEARALAPGSPLLVDGAAPALFEAFAAAAARPLALTPDVPPAAAVVLESAQGALLDAEHGFFPHVTPSRITRAAAEAAARDLGLAGPLEAWGVLRAYHTRHGEGPLPTHDAALTAALPEPHNRDDGPAGAFRAGWFDVTLARHALAFAGPIDHLVVTCLDRLPEPRLATWASPPTTLDAASAGASRPRVERAPSFVDALEAALGRRVAVESWGPAAKDKRLRAGVDARLPCSSLV